MGRRDGRGRETGKEGEEGKKGMRGGREERERARDPAIVISHRNEKLGLAGQTREREDEEMGKEHASGCK